MFDLTAPATIADPYPAYQWLRDEHPVYLWEFDDHPRGGIWLVTRYEDVRALVADDRCTKRPEVVGLDDDGTPPFIMFLDPPEHTRQRRPAVGAFTRQRVERMRDELSRDVAGLLAPVADGAEVDWMDEVALRLPLYTICRLMGVPLDDAPYLHELSARIIANTDAATGDENEVLAADRELTAYMREHVGRLVEAPGDDLLSAMVHGSAGEGTLTLDETVLMSTLLLVNGHETTVNLLGSALWLLLSHPEQWERLRTDPSLIASATEEALRYEAPTQRTSQRFAVEDLEFEGGTVPAGAQVSGVLGSANRDERVFADADRFDITRDPNPHLSFGRGRHHCPGAHLTRAECHEVLRQLVRLAPDLALVDRDPVWTASSADRGLASLRVRRGG